MKKKTLVKLHHREGVGKGAQKWNRTEGRKKEMPRGVFNASGNDPEAERGIDHLPQELTSILFW